MLGPVHPAAAALATNDVAPNFFNRSKSDPPAVLDLRRLVRKRDVDILHSSNIKAISLGYLLARRAGVATLLHFHDRVPPPAPLLPVMRHFARQADAAVAVSESVRALVATTYGLPPAQIAVLHNGVDLAAARSPSAADRAAQRVRLGLADTAPVIAIVGRIAPEKRQALLIRTRPAVLQARPDAVLLVVGDGPERLACEAEARRLGLDAAVRFLGQRPDVADVLAATDMLALTSICEPFGYVVVDAAALAVPAVAFASGVVPEIVRHEVTCLLVPQNDTERLAAALIPLSVIPSSPDALARRHSRRSGVSTWRRISPRWPHSTARCSLLLPSAIPLESPDDHRRRLQGRRAKVHAARVVASTPAPARTADPGPRGFRRPAPAYQP